MASIMSWGDLDDSSSFSASLLSSSTTSTVPGPGAITGRFLKAVGEMSLDLIVSIIIRSHLKSIEHTLEKSPHILRNPTGHEEWKRMVRAYRDLRELCRDSRSQYYSVSIQRAAAKLIQDITLITRPAPDYFIDASPTNEHWEALFARIQRREELLSQPQSALVDSTRQPASSVSDSSNDDDISWPWNFQHNVHVDEDFHGLPPSWATSLSEFSDESTAVDVHHRSSSTLRYRIFKSRTSGVSDDLPQKARDLTRKISTLRTGGLRKSVFVKRIQGIEAIMNEFSRQDPEPYRDVAIPQTADSVSHSLPTPMLLNPHDEGISIPWNFQHHVHVDEDLRGIPPSWSASLAGYPVELLAENTFNHKGKPLTLRERIFKSRAPGGSPLKPSHDPTGSWRASLSSAGGLEKSTFVKQIQDKETTANKLLRQDTGSSPFIATLQAFHRARDLPTLQTPIPPVTSSVSPNHPPDDGISMPWNFQHHVHVTEDFHGLPSSWSKALAETNFGQGKIVTPDTLPRILLPPDHPPDFPTAHISPPSEPSPPISTSLTVETKVSAPGTTESTTTSVVLPAETSAAIITFNSEHRPLSHVSSINSFHTAASTYMPSDPQ